MNNYLYKFKMLYDELGKNTLYYKDILLYEYQKMIVPIGPIMSNYSINKDDSKYIFKFFPSSYLIRLTNNFDVNNIKNWYAVICNKFYNLNEYSSNMRNKIRKGLKNVKVEKIDGSILLKYGYNVYYNSFERYKNAKPMSKNEFIKMISIYKNYSDIIHFWGVFNSSDGKLIAYAQNFVYDTIECNYSVIKFDPYYLKLYPSNALFYIMNDYYLNNEKFLYVNDGFKSLVHETNIQNYLIEKFHFKKTYLDINIYFKPFVSCIINLTKPMHSILSKINPKIKALIELSNFEGN